MIEHDDSGVGSRAALAFLGNRGLGAQRVANENGMREARIGHAQVRDRSAERSVAHRHSNHQPEREDAVYDALAELGAASEFRVEMKRLGIMGQRAEN